HLLNQSSGKLIDGVIARNSSPLSLRAERSNPGRLTSEIAASPANTAGRPPRNDGGADLLSAAGHDGLQQFLPWQLQWGQTADVLKAWAGRQHKKHPSLGRMALGFVALWFLWGIADALFPYISAPFRWAWRHTFATVASAAVD